MFRSKSSVFVRISPMLLLNVDKSSYESLLSNASDPASAMDRHNVYCSSKVARPCAGVARISSVEF